MDVGVERKCEGCGCRLWTNSHNHKRCKRCQRKLRNESRRLQRAGLRNNRVAGRCKDCGESLEGRGPQAVRCEPCATARYIAAKRQRNADIRAGRRNLLDKPPQPLPEPPAPAQGHYTPPPPPPAGHSTPPLGVFFAQQVARLRSNGMPGRAGFQEGR